MRQRLRGGLELPDDRDRVRVHGMLAQLAQQGRHPRADPPHERPAPRGLPQQRAVVVDQGVRDRAEPLVGQRARRDDRGEAQRREVPLRHAPVRPTRLPGPSKCRASRGSYVYSAKRRHSKRTHKDRWDSREQKRSGRDLALLVGQVLGQVASGVLEYVGLEKRAHAWWSVFLQRDGPCGAVFGEIDVDCVM